MADAKWSSKRKKLKELRRFEKEIESKQINTGF